MSNCQVEYTPPGPEEESAIIGLLKELIYNQKELANNQSEGFSSLGGLLNELISLAEPAQPPIEKHFSTEETAISIATPNKPESPDIIANVTTATPGYDRIQIHNIMNRNSPHVSVINDGSSNLFVITSTEGNTWSAEENPILVGEARLFFNIYELRIRSPEAGNTTTLRGGVYRATEYDYSLAYSATITPNRSDFTVRSVALVLANTDYVLDATTLPAAILIPNGFSIAIRGNVNNLGQVYISRTNATLANERVTLNPGEVVRLFVTNSNLIHVAAAGAGYRFDIIVEQ